MRKYKMILSVLVIALTISTMMPAAFAASVNTNLAIKPGSFSISPITIGSFGNLTLSGQDQIVQAVISDFTVTDARGNAKGWTVQVSATPFTNGTSALHEGALTISGAMGTSVGHSDTFDSSYIKNATTLTAVPSNYIVVPRSKGKGTFNFSGGKLELEIWPSEVVEGTYTSDITIDVVANID